MTETPVGEFLVGLPGPTRDWEFTDFNREGRRFAVHEGIARAFLTELSALSTSGAPRPETLHLPILPNDLAETEAVFSDALMSCAAGSRSHLASLRPPDASPRRGLRITASIGVAAFPADASSANDLLERADAAMYHSKQSGRDGVSYADAGRELVRLRS